MTGGAHGFGGVPDVQYAKTTDGLGIAYAIGGDGPPLLYVRALNSDVVRSWTDPWNTRYFGALARAFSVVVFDARGNGRSEPTEDIHLDGLIEDVDAVVRDAGLSHVLLYGQGFGSPVAIAYAARRPEVVDRLVLYCAYARGEDVVITDEFIDTMRSLPDAAVALMGRSTYPDEAVLPRERISRRNLAAPAGTAAAYFEFARTVNVDDALGAIRVPTLVLQPQRSPVVPEHLGREIAERVADGRFVPLPVGSYNPWAHDAVEPTLQAIAAFTGVDLPTIPASRRLAVLVTDMVGSTEMRHRVGEAEARRLHQLHETMVGDALTAYRGRQVKGTGDGVMATFVEARDAVACAVAIQKAMSDRERTAPGDVVPVRIGIATGDVVDERGDVSGTTVVLAVRIGARAKAGQILVPDDVREAATDAGFEIGVSRSLALKGFPTRVRLHEVLWDRTRAS